MDVCIVVNPKTRMTMRAYTLMESPAENVSAGDIASLINSASVQQHRNSDSNNLWKKTIHATVSCSIGNLTQFPWHGSDACTH